MLSHSSLAGENRQLKGEVTSLQEKVGKLTEKQVKLEKLIEEMVKEADKG